MTSGGGNEVKSPERPSPQATLRYQRSEFLSWRSAMTSLHLEAFDFCAAGLKALSAHASKTDQHEQVEMSPHLRRLVKVLPAKKDWVGSDS